MKAGILHMTGAVLCVLLCNEAESQDLEGMRLNKGIKATGGVNISNIIYYSDDSISRRDPYQLLLSGNLNLNLFGYDVPFSFTYSNSQRSYTQPFNRFSFTPKYKWVKAYIGRTSMTFSPYTLSGHTFKGAGLELTPGNWRFSLMGGEMKKAVKYDPLSAEFSNPEFKRMGYGVKLGYEKGTSAVSVNLFTAKDDRNSIDEIPANIQIHPMQNVAMGFSGHTSLLKHFVIEGEYSVSILNSDIRFPSDSAGDVNIFETTAPSTRKFDAYAAGAGYQNTFGSMMLKYERVAPDYQTMGAYYFNNDLENLTLAPSIRIIDGKLSFSGNIGLQQNNLDKSRNSTTRRFAGAGNMNLNISEKLNLTFNYSNFSTYTNVKPLEDPFFHNDMDTLNFYQLTNQAGTSINYSFGNNESPSNLMLLATVQKAVEAADGRQSDFLTVNASYTRALTNQGITFTMLYNINSSGSTGFKSMYHGPGLAFSRFFKEKSFRLAATSNFNLSTINDLPGSPVLASGINMNYSLGHSNSARHNITGNISWIQRFRSAAQDSRSEMTGTINYSYSF